MNFVMMQPIYPKDNIIQFHLADKQIRWPRLSCDLDINSPRPSEDSQKLASRNSDNSLSEKRSRALADRSTLPEELLRLFAVRLFSVVELNHFRSICTSWRSSPSGANKKHPCRSRPPLRHLSFVTTKEKNRVSNTYHLMFLSRAAFFRVTLCSSSSKQGWLIKSDMDINSGKFRLLDPFSQFPLPHSRESLDRLEFTVSEIGEAYAALSKCRGRTDRDFKKVVLVKANGLDQHLLGISRERYIESWDGEFWSRLEEMAHHKFSDIIVHKGLTYALDLEGTVWWIDSRLRIYGYGPLFEETITNGCCIEKSFVECCGELYIVERLFEESSRKRKADSLDSNARELKTVGFKFVCFFHLW
ncbi:PREDICTED: probable F-box protein At1g65740 [Camelina sativa]|uniref:Probable F-box protein At1g65740 n=1 Tax=Camelina sativa TaxID=90675 RepID=A0ABM0ZBT5_CAMSA|nr:PREDICTED: probable F-box protein At1g65740 [Camelina sativa]